jgi:hypothetical protein
MIAKTKVVDRWNHTCLEECPHCGSDAAHWVPDIRVDYPDFFYWRECSKCGKFWVYRLTETGWQKFDKLPKKRQGKPAVLEKIRKKK